HAVAARADLGDQRGAEVVHVELHRRAGIARLHVHVVGAEAHDPSSTNPRETRVRGAVEARPPRGLGERWISARSVRGRRRRRVGEDPLDGLADLVDLLEGGQEVDRAGLLPVVELLAVEVHLEAPAVGGREGDRRLAVVDRGELGRHTDGHWEVPSDDAVDDLDVALAFGHGGPPWSLVPRMLSVSPRRRNRGIDTRRTREEPPWSRAMGPRGSGAVGARRSEWPSRATARAGRPARSCWRRSASRPARATSSPFPAPR